MPPEARPLRLARLLRDAGARFDVVGSCARHRRGEPGPRDLDITLPPQDVGALADALARIGAHLDAGRAVRLRDVRVLTSYGPLDVFVRP